MKVKLVISIIILIAVGAAFFLNSAEEKESTFEGKRERVLSKLYLAIAEAEKAGKYNCCIEPACTMCYLGEWLWDDGTCDCDKLMLKGEWDKVCPQCKKGIEEGRCNSTIGACSIL